jgi:uncharacterized membrane protein (UPF0127 family)
MRALNKERSAVVASRVEVADTFLKRLRGLRGRDRMAEGSALWIVPCRGIHTRGMSFPIDALYLDREQRVVAIEQNLPPGRIASVLFRARTVLELPAGTVRRSATRVGDHIVMSEPQETR